MLQLCCPKVAETLLIADLCEAERIKEAERRHGAHLLGRGKGWWWWRRIFSSAQRRCSVESPVTPSRAREPILEEHPNDGHHRQAAIGKLRIQLGCPGLCIIHLADEVREADAIVARLAVLGGVLHEADGRARAGEETRCLNCSCEEEDLKPAQERHLGDCSKAIGNVFKFQVKRRAEVTREFEILWHDVANGCVHAHAAVLDLHRPAALEGGFILVCSKAQWIPKADRVLHTCLCCWIETLVSRGAATTEEVPSNLGCLGTAVAAHAPGNQYSRTHKGQTSHRGDCVRCCGLNATIHLRRSIRSPQR
mmetsp:Transcript_114177/g.368878  ORF Transcript_114177/g.368878 Transcript_114177/m.368878 type:complete len:308 (+) Transcript_114177:595-1518(+)